MQPARREGAAFNESGFPRLVKKRNTDGGLFTLPISNCQIVNSKPRLIFVSILVVASAAKTACSKGILTP